MDSQKKNSNLDVTRCQVLKLRCTKFDFHWGSVPDPLGEEGPTPHPKYFSLEQPLKEHRLSLMDPHDASCCSEVDAQYDKLAKVVGRTSTAASAVNLFRPTIIVCLTLSVHLCRAKRCSLQRAVAKFPTSRVWNTVGLRQESTLVFGHTRIYFKHNVGQVEESLCAKNQLDPSISFDKIPTCDRRTDGHRYRAKINTALLCVASIGPGPPGPTFIRQVGPGQPLFSF